MKKTYPVLLTAPSYVKLKTGENVYAHVSKGIYRIRIYRLGNIVKVLKLLS